MPSYSRGNIILVRFPFSDLRNSKVRPAVIVSASHPSQDVLSAGLNVASAVKRGIFTIHQDLVIATVGSISNEDRRELETSLRVWLGL